MKKFTESLDHSDDLLINGSGLFNHNSSIPKDKKLKIVKWHDGLSPEEKEYVWFLREEAISDEKDANDQRELYNEDL
jgi:hypothetical protein